MTKSRYFLCLLAAMFLAAAAGISAQTQAIQSREYSVFIILDTVDTWSAGIRDGIKTGLEPASAGSRASVRYSEFDTELNPEKAALIVEQIKAAKPDLIFVASFPDGFADRHITLKLKDSQYRFVSENAIPTQIGLINSWQRPGGNVTGVGVFVQLASQIRIAKTINPALSRLVFYS